MRLTVTVARNRIPELTERMRQQAEDIVAATVFNVEALAKTYVAVDTGTLRASIQGEADGLTGQVATGVEYAIYQEYGTYKMAAHPYMTPAAEQAWPAFRTAMEEALRG